MSDDLVFQLCNNGVLPAWLLLAVAPRWRFTQQIVHAVWIPGLLALVYGFALFSGGTLPEGSGFGSLQQVMTLFTSRAVVLAGWIHYLAFDLFVGAWEVRDAQRQRLHHALVLPCLFLTLMVGPLGFLLYSAFRAGLRRQTLLDETVVPALPGRRSERLQADEQSAGVSSS